MGRVRERDRRDGFMVKEEEVDNGRGKSHYRPHNTTTREREGVGFVV